MSAMINPPVKIELRWRKLIASIKQGKCILLLGPQASFDPNGAELLPLTTRLAHDLAKKGGFADDKDLVNPDDIAHVAQLFLRRYDHLDLCEEVKEFYDAFQNKTTGFHEDMAALPFTLCINTTFDNFFVNALTKAGKEPIQDYYNFKRTREYVLNPIYPPTIGKPYIFNLYGHCDNDNTESLVLTEDDLLEFLVNVIKGSPELPPYIPSQFANQEINFLFVGFGFHSWHNRILLHTLNKQNHINRYHSVAVEDQRFLNHPDYRQTEVFYFLHHKIKFEENLSLVEFAKKLRETYSLSGTPKEATTQALSGSKSKVFLCYASEDRDQVEQLSQQLQTADIEPWQDKQNLRAGDNWDRQLVSVIKKQVDYVIVVQTSAMTGQDEGYFYKEIAAALDRQKTFSSKIRFILPVMLSDCNLLEELYDFHAIRLDVPGGLEQLVDAIKTDWQQRRKLAAA